MSDILNVGCNTDSIDGVEILKISLETFSKTADPYPHEIVIWNNNYLFEASFLEKLPALKLIVNWGTDTSNLCSLPSDIKVSTTKGYCTEAVCDYILKQITRYHDSKKSSNPSIGFIGFGQIGQAVAKKLRPITQDIKFYTPSRKYFGEAFTQASIKEVAQQDLLVVCADTRETLLTKDLISSSIGSPKLIINVSRESTICPQYIKELIRLKKLKYYVSDNFDNFDHYHHQLCLFTGHIAYKSDISKKNKNKIFQFFYNRHLMESGQKKIFLTRHGETEWNAEGRIQGNLDSDVTLEGEAQVIAMSNFLASRSISTICASPLGRCQKSASILAADLGIDFETIPEIHEMDFGDFQGQLKSAVEGHPFFTLRRQDKLRTPYPNGESYQDVFDRIVMPVRKALVSSSAGNLLFVGHESLNRMIPPALTELITPETAVNHRQKNNEIVEIDLATGNRTTHEI